MKNKPVILISGCSSGIGLALANELASRGCHVFATARKPAVIKHLENSGIETMAMDVTVQKSIDFCVKSVIDKAGRIDMLVNNAGYVLIGPVIDLPVDELRLEFETNLIGLVALAKAVAPHMIGRRCGRIVNIGSVSGILATPFAGAYCASKAAVNIITDSMRMELAPFGIEVISVQPGAVKSDLGKNAAKNIDRYRNSIYSPIFEYIRERAYISQKNATDTKKFIKDLADMLSRKKVKKIIRAGKESIRLPLLKKLPVFITDKIFAHKFGLNKLTKIHF